MEVDVKIKRYMAASMRAALSQVREEQGPNAVILSSRRVDEGIEVIAAVDYDEALFVDATRLCTPAMAEARSPAAPAPVTSEPVVEKPPRASAPPAKASVPVAPVPAAPAPTLADAAAAFAGGG